MDWKNEKKNRIIMTPLMRFMWRNVHELQRRTQQRETRAASAIGCGVRYRSDHIEKADIGHASVLAALDLLLFVLEGPKETAFRERTRTQRDAPRERAAYDKNIAQKAIVNKPMARVRNGSWRFLFAPVFVFVHPPLVWAVHCVRLSRGM